MVGEVTANKTIYSTPPFAEDEAGMRKCDCYPLTNHIPDVDRFGKYGFKFFKDEILHAIKHLHQ